MTLIVPGTGEDELTMWPCAPLQKVKQALWFLTPLLLAPGEIAKDSCSAQGRSEAPHHSSSGRPHWTSDKPQCFCACRNLQENVRRIFLPSSVFIYNKLFNIKQWKNIHQPFIYWQFQPVSSGTNPWCNSIDFSRLRQRSKCAIKSWNKTRYAVLFLSSP